MCSMAPSKSSPKFSLTRASTNSRKAGNELVSLAFHEGGYALRYKLDQFPQGFYHGPPHQCAVEAMIGQGAMGTVYRATHLPLQRSCAL